MRLKIGTYPTGLLSPVATGIKAGLATLLAGDAESAAALPPAELREALGYAYHDAKAAPLITRQARRGKAFSSA